MDAREFWSKHKLRRKDGLCPHCRKRKRTTSGRGYCTECHRKYMREHRTPYADLPESEKRKARCRAYTNVLVARGKLKRGPCRKCGAKKVQAQHKNWDDPWAVTWICRACR